MEDVTNTGRMSIHNKEIIQLYSAATPNGLKVAACLEELCLLRSHKEDFNYEPVSIFFDSLLRLDGTILSDMSYSIPLKLERMRADLEDTPT